jgi:CRISPR-associated protein Cas1
LPAPIALVILAKDGFSAVCTVRFEPCLGVHHTTGRYGGPSLALDLMERFRPVIAGSVVLSLVNNGSVAETGLLIWRGACQLTSEGRRRFFQAHDRRKSAVVAHPTFGYKMSFGRMLEVRAWMPPAYVRGDVSRYIGFTVR